MEIIFVVEYADWAPSDADPVIVRPSKEIDDRTIRARAFPTEEKAMEYANKHWEYLKGAKYDEEQDGTHWLAYMRVFKCEKQLVKDYKS